MKSEELVAKLVLQTWCPMPYGWESSMNPRYMDRILGDTFSIAFLQLDI